MSNSSIENKILVLLDKLRTENNSRDRDQLSTVMDSPNISSSRNRPLPTLPISQTPVTRKQLNLPVSFQERNIDSTETDNKLKEIMKISGILTIGGVKYHTDISDMEHLGELGFGTCGQVVKMKHIPSGAIIAVKQMRRSGNSEENKRIIMDIDVVLKSHDCPYIVQCLGCFITDSDVWICMELMATCFDKLLKRLKRSIPENVLGKVTFATVKALSYLKEQHDVIHRDVKPSNILVDERGNVKLCDFGISGRLVDSMAKTRSAGCAAYMAPERIEPPNPSKPDYDIRADVWSLGITLVELATGVFPYKDCKTDFEVLTKVLSEDPPALSSEQEFSDEFRAFVACCLIKNYLDRPKYVKLLEQPFLKRYETKNVNVEEWFKNALKQADLLGANSPGRRYTPAPSNSISRRHISLQQQHHAIVNNPQLSNGGSVGPPNHHLMATTSLPPRQSVLPITTTFPFQIAAPNHHHNQRDRDLPAVHLNHHHHHHHHQTQTQTQSQKPPPPRSQSPIMSPYQQRRAANLSDGFWQSPISSPLPLRKYHQSYQNPAIEQQLQTFNTSPILLQRFYHQQKQLQQQQQHASASGGGGGAATCHDDGSKDDASGKKRFASHIKLQLVGDRCNMKSPRHQSPEPPPRLSRGPSQENSFLASNQSPLTVRRNNFLDANSAASPSLSRRYISPSPPQPPPRRLSESSSMPGSPQHFRARFHYTPEPQRRIFHNTDIS